MGTTKRTKQRDNENQEYTGVIIKRSDITKPHPEDVLHWAMDEGLEQYKKSRVSLYLSSLTAGLILGFAAMSVALVAQLYAGPGQEISQRIGVALLYPLGFVVCIMSGTHLFTEHTALAAYPVLDKQAAVWRLFKIWSIILLGNLTGTAMSSLLIHMAGDTTGISEGYRIILNHITHGSFQQIFISSLLAGWLMAQGGWLLISTDSSVARMASIYVVTFLIGLGQLHHSIAGSAELFLGMLNSNDWTYTSVSSFLVASILGNIVGGSVFVAFLNYSHIKHTAKKS